ncbi:DUF5819 family protein [Streptomyces bambusae]|uniref:DUF5819 family protein n=1 Tax=Streptomyces bambusae TaxID=1550616 RepID=UPI001CFC6A96|nr:DUF5819 family protein [Streptomyces bambusae]MCB5163371.1 DUF5819 family protein [Streptomyces bambusae]
MDSNEQGTPRGPAAEADPPPEPATPEVPAEALKESPPDAGPEAVAEQAPDPVETALASRPAGIAGLSRPYRIAAAVVLAAVGVAACWHLGLVFLHVAPANALTKQHAETTDAWIYPEFEQNWKLFAPNPLQQNIAVEARAQVRSADGNRVTTDWQNLSAADGAFIRHNPFPSHVQQNELRRAWDFYTGSHDDQNRATGDRGKLSEAYLRRIAVRRLQAAYSHGAEILRVQIRSATTNVAAPPWSDEKTDTKTYHRQLPWWDVTEADR